MGEYALVDAGSDLKFGLKRSRQDDLKSGPRSLKNGKIVNVSWNERLGSWGVEYRINGKKTTTQFLVSQFLSGGRTYEEADQAALQAAGDEAGRAALAMVRSCPRLSEPLPLRMSQMPLSEPRRIRMEPSSQKHSGCPSVLWNEQFAAWQAERISHGKREVKQFFVRQYMHEGRSFEEANQIALAAAIAFTNSREREKTVNRMAIYREPLPPSMSAWCGNRNKRGERMDKTRALPIYRSDVPGVSWCSNRRYWQAHMTVHGKRLARYFRTQDDTPAEIVRARRKADAQRRAWEREYNIHSSDRSRDRDLMYQESRAVMV